jgi:GNAT superfamily N-acetyltransferase
VIVYQEMKSGEVVSVCELVEQVFQEFVAPDFEQEGIAEFFRFANPSAMATRIRAGGFVLLAKEADKVVGMLEFTLPTHIAMLFVTRRRQGIAKELVVRAIKKARSQNPVLSKVTVHSSPYAVAAYRRMGFCRRGNLTTDHGIRYIPMEFSINRGHA